MEPSYLSPLCYEMGDLVPVEDVADWTGREIELQRLLQAAHKKCSVSLCGPFDLLDKVLSKVRRNYPDIANSIDLIIAVFPVTQLDLGACFAKNGFNRLPFIEVLGGQCASTILAIQVASMQIASGRYDNVLVVTCDTVGTYDRAILGGRMLLGDGASCAVVSARGLYKVKAAEFVTDWLMTSNTESEDPKKQIDQLSLSIDAVEHMIQTKMNLSDFEPAHYISINSKFGAAFQKSLSRFSLKTPFDVNCETHGHMMNSDYFVNLKDFTDEQIPVKGEIIILAGHGANTVGYVILEL